MATNRITAWRGDRAFYLEVAKGNVVGHSVVDVHGGNPDVGTGAFEDLWDEGGLYTGWLQTAVSIRIKAGGSVNDIATTGSGMRRIEVFGLDENWAEVSEVIACNGASASTATTATFIRIRRIIGVECGSYGGTNAAAIVVETTGGTELGEILAGLGESELCLYTVPAGHTFYMTELRIDVNSSKTATVRLNIREGANNTSSLFCPWRTEVEFNELTGDVPQQYLVPVVYSEYTDIIIAAQADGGASTAVHAEFEGVLAANT